MSIEPDWERDGVRLYRGDCLEVMPHLSGVDMVMTDPPYGTTACKWDSVIPLEPMWERLNVLTKKNGAIVMTASQPFTTTLIASNIRWFRYCWYWEKEKAGNFQLANKRAMKRIEEVCVFCDGQPTYNPRGLVSVNRVIRNNKEKAGSMGHLSIDINRTNYNQNFTNYPTDRLNFNNEKGAHECQKPVALMIYLIETYTNERETVLDFTMGSGSTGVACVESGRDFIGIEKDPAYFDIAVKRISKAMDQGRLFT